MSRCVILSACPVSPALAAALRPDDTIIACDAGYRNCEPLGCRPDIIVGDFDTAPCPAQEEDDIVVLPHVKDDTDTEYAAKLASEKGFDEALLLGALGGRRLEHTLANLCTGLGLHRFPFAFLTVARKEPMVATVPTRPPPRIMFINSLKSIPPGFIID